MALKLAVEGEHDGEPVEIRIRLETADGKKMLELDLRPDRKKPSLVAFELADLLAALKYLGVSAPAASRAAALSDDVIPGLPTDFEDEGDDFLPPVDGVTPVPPDFTPGPPVELAKQTIMTAQDIMTERKRQKREAATREAHASATPLVEGD